MNAPARTLSDIAQLAGVSKSTVSRALNDSPLIPRETKDRIRLIAAEHRFAPNEPARRLSRGQSNVAGLVMFGDPSGHFTPDMFMLELMGGVSTGLLEQGYELLVVQPRAEDEHFARRYVDSGRADGFIVLSAACAPRRLELLVESGVPFVVWGRRAPGSEFSSVSGDNFNGGRAATQHLLDTGRRRIAFLGGPDWAPEVAERRRGYEEALLGAGLDVDPALILPTPWHDQERYAAEAVGRLLDAGVRVDGIVTNSDRYALGAIEAVRARGLDVPYDVGIVGYDDVAFARLATPPLTTIRQDGALAGRLLARALVQHVQTGAVADVSMPAELVVRESA
jgi:DNA-binding LacI/PurR family transcriptional regulator